MLGLGHGAPRAVGQFIIRGFAFPRHRQPPLSGGKWKIEMNSVRLRHPPNPPRRPPANGKIRKSHGRHLKNQAAADGFFWIAPRIPHRFYSMPGGPHARNLPCPVALRLKLGNFEGKPDPRCGFYPATVAFLDESIRRFHPANGRPPSGPLAGVGEKPPDPARGGPDRDLNGEVGGKNRHARIGEITPFRRPAVVQPSIESTDERGGQTPRFGNVSGEP